MSIDAMKQALEALELLARYENPATKIQVRKPRDGGSIVTMYPHKVASEAATALRAAIEQTNDWDEVEALRESLREHMAEIHRLRQWQSLTDNEIALICGECAASTHQTDDLSYARAIEAKLREKNA